MTLVAVMMVSTFQFFAITVLSVDIIEEFDISRGAFGWIAAVNAGAGALLSLSVGRLTDRIGGRRAATLWLFIGGVGLLWTAMAANYWTLLGASVIAGSPAAGGNPATNKLIGQHVPIARRGIVTGFKQSGVQLGNFLAGLTLPAISALFGWRIAIGIYGSIMLIVAAMAAIWLPADLVDEPVVVAPEQTGREPLLPVVHRMAIYGLLMGTVGGGVGRFMPLFAQEDLGFSQGVAGLVVAVSGLLGIAARIIWGLRVERGLDARKGLTIMGVGAAATSLLLVVASSWAAWLIWACAALMAFTISAWNVVGMLTIIREVPGRMTGRASGMVMMGFFAGVSIGAPMTGWIVDTTGGYTTGWLILAGVAVAAALVAAPFRSKADSGGSFMEHG